MRAVVLLAAFLAFVTGLGAGALLRRPPECRCANEPRSYLPLAQWELAKSLGEAEVADKARRECLELIDRRAKGLNY